jgi:hypothetical protein
MTFIARKEASCTPPGDSCSREHAAPRSTSVPVYPPVPEALARGVIILQFRTENLRTMAVFGPKAAEVSPHIGHLHVTVDGGPVTWAHTSEDPVIIVGLAPGPHKIRLEIADPTHRILTGDTVEVTVPDTKGAKSHSR